jgi:hypothetical protein
MTTSGDTTSVAWVCGRFPRRVRGLFQALDLDRPGLSAAKKAAAAEDWEGACEALLEYYRTCTSGKWLRHASVAPGNGTVPAAEKMAQALFPVPGQDIRIPRLPSGGLNWAYVPPENGGTEWVYGINRHDYMREVLAAFYATGNRAYVRCLDEHLHDWCAFVDRPEKNDSAACPWGTILEPGHRVKVWPAVFYGLQQEEAFSAATRILMLSQALDHATFLRQFHSKGSNWVITEMAGLLSVACVWPEFREADEWRELALRLGQDELRQQVYPDRVQKELSSNYQAAVLWHMGNYVETAQGAGVALDPDFMALLEGMWNYLAYSLGPNGLMPQNSDSDRCQPSPDAQVIKPLEAVQPILDAAEVFHRPDWTYIATNGARGVRPAGLPSILFPWAGQLIMRSGWEADAQWAFFDLGPWGILHQHNDSLHLSVTAFGRDLLVDSGRYTYENYLAEKGTWRSYFVNSAAHNVILIDGLVQADGPTTTERPLDEDLAMITQEYDYAQGTFAGGFTDVATASARLKAILWRQPTRPEVECKAIHTRAVLYLRGVGWVVVDRIETDRPRRIAPLWHFHPACTVVREGQSVVTVDLGVGNLRVQPLGPIDWDIEFVRGREGPDFQGWYSPEMGVRIPNTCACYAAQIQHTTTFAWLLATAKGAVPAQPVQWIDAHDGEVHLKVQGVGSDPLDIVIRLNDREKHGTRVSVKKGT